MLANAIKTSNNLPTLSRNQLQNLDHQTAKNLTPTNYENSSRKALKDPAQLVLLS